MDNEKSDEEIINLYKSGNQEIFKLLIDRYSPILFNFSARLAGKENSADILQDVFIKVWKKINNFDEKKSSFKTWLFTVTKNTIIDFLRKKKVVYFSSLDEEESDFADTIVDENLLQDEIAQKLEEKNNLILALEKLNPEWKTILVLHYEEEMTFEEIGEVLDRPLNTVKSIHHRALRKLREML